MLVYDINATKLFCLKKNLLIYNALVKCYNVKHDMNIRYKYNNIKKKLENYLQNIIIIAIYLQHQN